MYLILFGGIELACTVNSGQILATHIDTQCKTTSDVQSCKMEERLPDLIFVSESIADMCGKTVMQHIQHHSEGVFQPMETRRE